MNWHLRSVQHVQQQRRSEPGQYCGRALCYDCRPDRSPMQLRSSRIKLSRPVLHQEDICKRNTLQPDFPFWLPHLLVGAHGSASRVAPIWTESRIIDSYFGPPCSTRRGQRHPKNRVWSLARNYAGPSIPTIARANFRVGRDPGTIGQSDRHEPSPIGPLPWSTRIRLFSGRRSLKWTAR